MIKHWLYILILMFVCTSANGESISNIQQIKKDFAEAWNLMLSFKNDSAIVILDRLILDLNEQGELDSSLGLQIQLRHAEALEKDHQDENAIEELIYLVEISNEKKQGDVLANAHLSLARLFEKIGRKDTCYEHLQYAKAAITEYYVDSLYTRYCIRTSSYHRIFSDQDSAMYYAEEVIRTAPKYNYKEEYAVGNLLLGMLYASTDNEKSKKYYKAAGRTWYVLEDFNGYGAVMGNISSMLFREKKYKEALIYNDSALYAAERTTEINNDGEWMFFYNYKKRANIYNKLAQPDSAWYYLNKGYELELDLARSSKNDKIIEIDAKYKDEKQAETIIKQKEEIRRNIRDRQILFIIATVFILLAALLSYFYFQLKKANNKTEKQSILLQETNDKLSNSIEEQIMLRGEIHHRVKNNLQVIISLLELQMDELEDPILQSSFTAMSNRIYSISAIHEILYQKEGSVHIEILTYVENLCMHFSNFSNPENKPSFLLNMGDYEFNLVTSMPLGIIITELLTNSLKYARINGQILEIEMSLKETDEGYFLTYKDNGQGYPNGMLEEREGGLGTYLINSMVRQLNSKARFFNEDGANFNLIFKEKSN